MSRTTRRFFSASAAALGIALIGFFSSTASAASISYGNFGPVPPGVTFLNVQESSGTDPVPLYGPPVAFATGLDFDPTSFGASGAGGAADLTDGQLNFTVMASNITSMNVAESGAYTLSGIGTLATRVLAGAIVRGSVTQINGVNVAPVDLGTANASVAFSLPFNAGVAVPWSISIPFNVAGALAAQGFGANQHATKVDFAINNQLIALSEPGSVASISKQDFVITTHPGVPEPATLGLAGMALCGMAVAARRRKS
jgi:hypothetical protein